MIFAILRNFKDFRDHWKFRDQWDHFGLYEFLGISFGFHQDLFFWICVFFERGIFLLKFLAILVIRIFGNLEGFCGISGIGVLGIDAIFW